MNTFFFDANVCIGKPINAPTDASTADELLRQLDRAGVERALVWHVAQREHDPLIGNALLAEAIAPCRDRLIGCWSILPTCTGEIADPDRWFAQAAAAGVRAMRAWPTENRYLLRGEVLAPILDHLQAANWPLLLAPGDNLPWATIYDLLAEYPELTVVLTDVYCWGVDRYVRPLIERYPNVHLEISDYFVDGGLEAFVDTYGPARLLFGSGYPTRYIGAMMLALAGSELSDADKAAIAGGNLQRLIERVRA